MRPDPVYCDNCADTLQDHEQNPVTELPVDVDSANAGESAVLCPECLQDVEARANAPLDGLPSGETWTPSMSLARYRELAESIMTSLPEGRHREGNGRGLT